MGKKLYILSLTSDQWIDECKRRYGKSAYHSAGVYRHIYRGGIDTARGLADLPTPQHSHETRLALERDLAVAVLPLVSEISENGVTKYAHRLEDGRQIESVIVPMANHQTVCISSQVGCRMGCRFCETGRQGFIRSLSVDEIVAQVFQAVCQRRRDIRSVVFMGMGEPLDNLENVAQAIRVISDQRGLNIAKRHITVSTSCPPSGLEQLAGLKWPDLRLAVSLNAPNDRIRSQIMPVNRSYPMVKIREALAACGQLGGPFY